jgi:hypothetical protein
VEMAEGYLRTLLQGARKSLVGQQLRGQAASSATRF